MSGIRAQFRKPSGPLGWIVGWAMDVKNGGRSQWALGLLAPQPGERIVEVGFGPGADVSRLLDAVGSAGLVAGIDASEVMVRYASGKNRRAVEEGRALLRQAVLDDLPDFGTTFDAAYSVNCAQFWPDLAAGLAILRRVVRPGGRAVIAVQPMNAGASRADSERWLRDFAYAAEHAGWVVATREVSSQKVPTAAVVLRNEAA